MINVEQSFYSRFPSFARGRRRALTQPMLALLRRMVHEERINHTLARLDGWSGLEFVDRCIDELGIRRVAADVGIEHIPAHGRVVIVANHPLGAVDALLLLQRVGMVRPDVKILANELLQRVPGLAPLLLPCDVFSGQRSARLRAAYRALEREQALIVFPAGEVSRIGPYGVRDARWATGFLRLARRTGAPVVPIHVEAHNSAAFYGMSMLAKPLATLMLPREMFAAARVRLRMTVGAAIAANTLAASGRSDIPTARRMRAHLYRLPRGKPALFLTLPAIAGPVPVAHLRMAVGEARRLGETTDGKQILLFERLADGPLLHEIGRLRELSFRAVGEGSGRALDLDEFDRWYSHIVLWDDAAGQIVGAYRVAPVAPILATRGMDGLYSASLFRYSDAATCILQRAAELGRSFVQPRYWGSRSLDYLWQGIGAFVRARPEIRYLLGPVSLSARLGEHARGWIASYHQRYYGDGEGLARACRPYTAAPEVVARAERVFAGLDAEQGLACLRAELAACQTSLPVLYKQYVGLCAPEGVRFLDFAVDPDFADCVDGLICLDLDTLKPGKRARYLGAGNGRERGAPAGRSRLCNATVAFRD